MRVATATISLLLLWTGAWGQLLTGTETQGRGIACWQQPAPVAPAAGEPLAPDLIELTTGGADIQPGGDASFAGPIEIRTQDRLLQADSATYDSAAGVFSARGTIQFQDAQARVSGTAARYDTRNGQFSFSDAEFELYETPARGSAQSVNVFKAGVLELDRVTYTSCPPGNRDWLLQAREIELDTEKGTGTARGASLRFKGVPFFYVPYFTYPITDQRKTGLLFPTFATSDQRGFEVTQPVYWNIAPNYDATFQPRYMSNRGLQLGAETRLLLPANNAELTGDYLPSDEGTGTARWRYDLTTTSMLPKGWRAQINAQGVSDQTYFEDLSQRQVLTSRPNLLRELSFEYFGDIWSVTALAQDYQNLDPIITPEQEPYLQLPQVAITGVLRDGLFGLDYRLDSEATYFYRDDSVTGARVHVQPEVSLPMRRGGLFFTPQVALDYTTYALQDQEAGADDTPSRAAPIVSIDTGAVFDRPAGRDQNYLITLEPRALYAYVPFRDQNEIPIFDTIRPNFNLIQLYRRNQFIGFDRLSDTNQISLGASSRVLNANDGRQLLTATIGQTIFLDDSNVVLPDEAPSSADSTDYIGELAVDIWRTWGLDLRYQYDADTKQTARTSVRLRLRPDEFKAINIAYRFVQDSVEQTDISFAWPLGKSWDFIGRYNYSLRDKKALDRFVGVEYNGCCWGISLLGRRTVQRSTGQSDSAIGFQFILKGFSNLGSKTARELKRDIVGGMRYQY